MKCPSCQSECKAVERDGRQYLECTECGPLVINGDGSVEPVESIPERLPSSDAAAPAEPEHTAPPVRPVPADIVPAGTQEKTWGQKLLDDLDEALS